MVKRSAIKARTQAANQITNLIVTGPETTRDELRGLTPLKRAQRAGRCRPGTGHDPATVTRRAIRALARRWLDLTDEINRHNREVDELVQLAAPNAANPMQGTHGHLPTEQKRTAFRLRSKGWRLIDIAKEVGCTAPMVGLMVRDGKHLDADPFGWKPRSGSLSIDDREQILLGLSRNESLSSIANALSRSPSTITREVNANGGRDYYSAWQAHHRARDQARRPKPCKLDAGRLRDEVARRLQELWSPDEISKRLLLDFPDDPEMRVSHETIYQSLFVQGRGELRRELARCLRSGRTKRRTRGTPERRGRLPGMVMISDRPAEAEDRAVPGHWESQ